MASLAKSVDKFVADHSKERMAAFVVLLDEDSEANQKKLAEFAAENKLTLPLTIAMDGKPGPGSYKLNADVPLTVLVAVRNTVKANFVFPGASPDEKAVAKESEDVLAAANKMLAER